MEPTFVTINAVGKARRVFEGGREYLDVPMTSIVEGVLPGSKGPLYYHRDDIKANPSQWDGTTIVVYHPTHPTTGVPLPVDHPDVPDAGKIGVLRNTRVRERDGQPVKLQHVGRFDVEKTKVYDAILVSQGRPPILNRIERGEPVELSTGLFTTNVPAPAGFTDWRGQAYSGPMARQHKRDHLAVLPDQRGACSVKDGCGVLIDNATTTEPDLWDVLTENCGGAGGKPGPCPTAPGKRFDITNLDALKVDDHPTMVATRRAMHYSKKANASNTFADHALAAQKQGKAQVEHEIEAKKTGSHFESKDHLHLAGKHATLAKEHMDALGVKTPAPTVPIMARNEGMEMKCVFNAEQLCVNCGGKGGTRGPCKGQARGGNKTGSKALSGVKRAYAESKGQSVGADKSSKQAIAASHDTVFGTKAGHATAIDRHNTAADKHDSAATDLIFKAKDPDSVPHDKVRKHFATAQAHRELVEAHKLQMTATHNINQTANHSTETYDMKKTELVQWLTTNCAHYKDKATMLGQLDEAVLAGMKSDAEKALTANSLTNNCAGTTLNDLLKAATPQEQATWNTAVKIEQRERTRLVGILTANTADATKRAAAVTAYGGMATDVLEALVDALPPVTNATDPRIEASRVLPLYAGSAPPFTPPAPTRNAYDGTKTPLRPFSAEEEIPEDNPVLNYRKKHAVA